jgi:hypothetical protein
MQRIALAGLHPDAINGRARVARRKLMLRRTKQ